MITRSDVVAEARRWIDTPTPFAHQARCLGVGVDCLGLIGEVGYAIGAERCEDWPTRDEELSAYGRTPRPDILIRRCDEILDRIAIAAAGLGDILLMAFKVFPQHFAIVSNVAPMRVIHAYPLPGVARVVENGLPLAGAHVIRAYRFRGVTP